ncbi:MAG: hypothetical protein AAF355_11265 [Myxococcota bacterium]
MTKHQAIAVFERIEMQREAYGPTEVRRVAFALWIGARFPCQRALNALQSIHPLVRRSV